jgi:hypothetical protein
LHRNRLSEEHLQQVDAVPAHVDKASAAAELGILPPCALYRRIPAAKLSPCEHHLSEPAFLNHLQCSLVLRLETHHERRPKLNRRLPARIQHRLRLCNRQTQRLLAQDVLACVGGSYDLVVMQIGGGGDVDRVDFLAKQLILEGARLYAKLRRKVAVGLLVDVINGDELGIRRLHYAFGNGPPHGDAAGPYHAPTGFCRRHW